MISVCKIFEFEAAHHLPFHTGKCKNLHGHSYKLEVEVTGKIGKNGMIVDFGNLKKVVQAAIIDNLDHVDLNTVYEIPTAEIMVNSIASSLQSGFDLMRAVRINVVRVRLWETSSSYAEWREE